MKRYILTLLLIAIIFPVTASAGTAHAEQQKQVLLVYDSLSLGASAEGNVDALKRLLGVFDVDVTTINIEHYEQNLVNSYSHVIILRNKQKEEQAFDDDALMHDMERYTGKYLHIGAKPASSMVRALALKIKTEQSPAVRLTMDGFSNELRLSDELTMIVDAAHDAKQYGSIQEMMSSSTSPYALIKGNYAYLSFYLKGDLSEWAAGYVLKDWMNVDQAGGMYVLLTEVYPFSDLELLREISDQLYQAGIPFLVSANPIFSNFDYPAAKRYAETLGYMQARNGSILIDAPTVSSQTISADLSVLSSNIVSYINFLVEHSVVPLGATAELYWFEDEYYLSEGLRFYDSVIMLPNVKMMSNQPTNRLQVFPSSMYSLELEQWKKHADKSLVIEDMPFNIALTIDMLKSADEAKPKLEWLSEAWVLFRDYKLDSHSVTTEQAEVVSEKGTLRLNGNDLQLKELYNEISSEHVYIEQKEASFEKLFTVQNRIFIVLITIVLIVFAVLLWIGYRLYRKKYVE